MFVIAKHQGQTSQVSRFCRETHDFQLNLTVSRYATKISRLLENLTFFKENLPFFSVQIQPQRTNKSRSARGLSPKNPYLENQCQIRLSLAISAVSHILNHANVTFWCKSKWRISKKLKLTLLWYFYYVLHRKRATCFCVAPQNI